MRTDFQSDYLSLKDLADVWTVCFFAGMLRPPVIKGGKGAGNDLENISTSCEPAQSES